MAPGAEWQRCGIAAQAARSGPSRAASPRSSSQALRELYRAGPRAAGFESDRWTTVRFAQAIFARFGVRYDPDHVGRIMHRLGLRERRRPQRMPDVVFPSQYRAEQKIGVA